MCTWDVLKDHVKTSKDIVDNYRTMFWLQSFSQEQLKNYHARKICVFLRGPTIWKGHAKKCVERYCELANKTTQQLYISIYSMHRWPPLQRRRNKIRGRIVTSMLSDCSEMIILGTSWTTWYSMVSEQTCTIDHKMDQNMWQTIISFDLLHPSYMWLQTILSCGKHCTNNAGWECFRTLILPEILKTRKQQQEEFCAFSRVTRLFPKIGCARNKLQFHTVLQKLKSFLSMQVYAWMEFQLLIFGVWLLKCCTLLPTNLKKSKENVQGNLLHGAPSTKHANSETKTPTQNNDLELCNVDYVFLKREVFSTWCDAYHFWR